MTQTHVPVLAGELIDLLDPHPGETAVDCTFGGGGHARLIADRLGPEGTLIGIDRDPVAEERFSRDRARAAVPDSVHPGGLRHRAWASSTRRASRPTSPTSTSACPRCRSTRGSAASRTPTTPRSTCGWVPIRTLTAREIVNEWDERQLARLLREYGEERYATRIARAIVRARAREELVSTQQLVEVIKAAVPVPAQFAGGHPARRTFQALRIAVNDELSQLDAALPAVWNVLRTGGRIGGDLVPLARGPAREALPGRPQPAAACARRSSRCACAVITRRRSCSPAGRSRRRHGEVEANPRSKSAHLRAARKLEGDAE